MDRLEHVNLVVKDIQPSVDFLLSAFPQWKIRGQGQGQWAGQPRNWAHVGDDNYYLTLNDGAEGETRDLKGLTPGLAHLGFVVDDVEAVIQRLTNEGYEIDILGRNHPYRKTVYFIDPNGFQFEFMQYLSDDAVLKNQYGGETGDLIKHKPKAHSISFNAEEFLHQLYQQVDAKNVEYLDEVLNQKILFRIADNPALSDKRSVLEGNKNFFNSIHSMKHSLAATWQEGDQIGCHGQVDYVRLDGSEISASFSTTLKIENNKISEYRVFADLSAL